VRCCHLLGGGGGGIFGRFFGWGGGTIADVGPGVVEWRGEESLSVSLSLSPPSAHASGLLREHTHIHTHKHTASPLIHGLERSASVLNSEEEEKEEETGGAGGEEGGGGGEKPSF